MLLVYISLCPSGWLPDGLFFISRSLRLRAGSMVLIAVSEPECLNLLINITLQGRHDTYPKRRGLTRMPELMAFDVGDLGAPALPRAGLGV